MIHIHTRYWVTHRFWERVEKAFFVKELKENSKKFGSKIYQHNPDTQNALRIMVNIAICPLQVFGRNMGAWEALEVTILNL